jgi:hypothetical protein
VQGLEYGRTPPIDLEAGWQMVEGVIQQRMVLRPCQRLDSEERVEQRDAQSAGVAKEGGAGGAEFFEVGRPGEQSVGIRRQGVFEIVQETGQDRPVKLAQQAMIGKECQVHGVFHLWFMNYDLGFEIGNLRRGVHWAFSGGPLDSGLSNFL